MNFKELIEASGFIYLGVCGCTQEKGDSFQHPDKREFEVRFFYKSKRIKVLQYDVEKKTIPLTEQNLIKIINEIKEPVQA